MKCSEGKKTPDHSERRFADVNNCGLDSEPFPSTDLKRDTTDWQVATILQHVEVFCHQRCAVDQTVGSFSVVSSLTVFSRHVLEPRQTQVGRVLVALCNPGEKKRTTPVFQP